MERLIKAFENSVAAFQHLARNETAFKQECILFAVALPAAYFVAASLGEFLLLMAVIVLVLIVEVLNTGIEAVCDAVSEEFDANIKIAKDCGSLAVLLAILIAFAVWALAIANWFIG